MKRPKDTHVRVASAVALVSLWSITTPALASPEAALGGYDIGALMESAGSRYDMSSQDAVVLLDDEQIDVGDDGTLRTTGHTIVWFSTELGLDAYADIRVPYNTETSDLDVLVLRTWRDGRWWPDATELSPTAIVETTPNAVRNADDYTTMREMVLLHDGVELPCVVETAYIIVERGGALPGIDGRWTVRGPDPVALSRMSIRVPAGTGLSYSLKNGAPEPGVSESGQGSITYQWEVELADRLPRPLTSERTAYTPCVVWSTWPSWEALAEACSSSIDQAAVLTDALRESVAQITVGLPFPLPRIQALSDFLRENTRYVSYDDAFWRLRPRSAARTWETAYGHRLDRVVLAAALMREAGCEVTPAFVSSDRTPVDLSVPAVSWFDGLTLRLEAEGVMGTFDPVSARLTQGDAPSAGKTVWLAARGEMPRLVELEGARPSLYQLALSIEPDEEGGWTGSGLLRTSGALSAYGRMAGLEDQSGGFLEQVAGSVLPGAAVEQHCVSELVDGRAAAGFRFGLEASEPDDLGRTRLVVGDPEGGIVSNLPEDIHIYSGHRDSPVLLPGPLEQTVTIALDPGDLEDILVPAPASLTNDAGSFDLRVERKGDGTLVIERSLSIAAGPSEAGGAGRTGYDGLIIPAESWPMLRDLLLAESDPRHRTILLK